MEDRKMIVTDKDGNEKEMYIMFTYTHEETKKNYVFYTDPKDENQEAFVSSYDEEGNLFAVETDEEWELLEDVFAQFQTAGEEEHECGCGHHHHNHECGCEHHHEHDHECCCEHECCCGHHDCECQDDK